MKKLAILLIFFVTISVSVFFFYVNFPTIYVNKSKVIEIEKGESIKSISKKLQQRGIIDNWLVFYVYSIFRGKPLKYGFYEFSGKLSIHEIWNKLYIGKEKLIKFTIFPGDDLIDISDRLQKLGIVKKEDFIRFVFNPENVERFHLKGKSFEGYFPPETYFLRKKSSVSDVVKTFLKEFERKYRPFEKKFKQKGMDFYRSMIIASLIEKETYIEQEKPVITGVIFNRLKLRMHLQIDPTVIYALKVNGRWNGRLSKEDMRIASPFNTYVNYGLPPTPICSFTLNSLKAVLEPSDTDFLYYVFDGKKHIFSKSYNEHREIIRKLNRK